MTKQQRIADRRAKAAEYRVIARQSDDEETAHELFKLAAELEKEARDIERKK